MAQEQDVLNEAFRKQVLDEITAPENEFRKNESRRRYAVYNNNLLEIVKSELAKEYSLETVEQFRTQTSINLVPRIIKEKASIYKNAPERTFTELNDVQEEYVKELYLDNKFNVTYKNANTFYKLQDQDTIQWIPQNGKIHGRVLQPHHYDVIPSDQDVMNPMCYIVNLLNEERFIASFSDSTERHSSRNFTDEIIADWDDQKRFLARFSWWTDNYNFITNGFGGIVSDTADITNSLGTLPFVDVADPSDKDFRFWVFKQSLLVRFQIDFCKDLTDLSETMKMQGFSTGILIAEKKPESINIGARKFMFIPLDPNNPQAKPSFDFKNPTPDLLAQMNIILDKLSMFLSTQGIDPKLVSGVANVQQFNSGVERLLSQIQRFEASNDDLDLFRWVESRSYGIIKGWNNILAADLAPGFQMIPDESEVMVNFEKPEVIETKKEREDRQIVLVDNSLQTRKKAIMNIHEVDQDTAEEMMKEIENEMPSIGSEFNLTDTNKDNAPDNIEKNA